MKYILFLIALASTAFSQTNYRSVMVDTNGVVQRPTNFFAINNILTNQTPQALGFNYVLNLVNRVNWTANQWTVITNVGSWDVSDGRMVIQNLGTNSGSSAIAYMGANIGGMSVLNLSSDSGISIDSGSGLIFQGSLGGSRVGVVKRFVIRGVSSGGVYDDVGSLDRAGWAVETRLDGTTNQARLIVHTSSGVVASGWTIAAGVSSDVKTIWTWRDATNTYVQIQKDFGNAFDTNATITVTNVPGGTGAASTFSIGVAIINTSNVSSGAYFDIGAITETKNFNP
jgi:hypothetical protein